MRKAARLRSFERAPTPTQQEVVTGGVYVIKDGKRVGAIGCAKVYIDDEPHPSEKYDQRYINDQSLPITLDKQSQTLPNRGFFTIAAARPRWDPLGRTRRESVLALSSLSGAPECPIGASCPPAARKNSRSCRAFSLGLSLARRLRSSPP